MNFKEYQKKANTFAEYEETHYPFLGLAEEVGEFLGIAAKRARGDNLIERYGSMDKLDGAILKEAGDILWMLAECLTSMGLSLQEVAEANIAKLTSRKERGVIKGAGDDR